MKRLLAVVLGCAAAGAYAPQALNAQEAGSGFDVRATLTAQGMASGDLTEAPRSGSPVTAGFRGVAYPTWKISSNWTVTGAFQLYTRPFFYAGFSEAGYGAKGNILQASLNYSRVSDRGSLLVRAGELSTAFGSFLLRYDDAENPLIDSPPGYGYYYTPISTLPVAGAQVDATRGRWDGRLQFANSSPANPRSVLARDQYGNWAGGAGYTIRQGLRVGMSGYRGPYLDRHFKYFFPGEAKPSTLSARALGVDAAWSRGHTNLLGEWQQFTMPYKLIPTFREKAGYGELRQVLSPRWFVAARVGMTSSKAGGREVSIEPGAGFRLGRFQLIKFSYEEDRYTSGKQGADHTFAVQFVSSLHFAAGRE